MTLPQMQTIDPSSRQTPEIYKLLTSGIGPRPIALVSTISKNGIVNLAPFSFFNIVGIQPPIVIFSPSHRGIGKKDKDTLENIRSTNECVIHTVTENIMYRTNLSSAELDNQIDEFEFSGFTKVPSHKVTPPRVNEAAFQLECQLQQIVSLGDQKGAGQLVICKVILFHVQESILEHGILLPERYSLAGRNGRSDYTLSNPQTQIHIPRPANNAIALSKLPTILNELPLLTQEHYAQLAAHPKNISSDDLGRFLLKLDSCAPTFENIYSKKFYDMLNLGLTYEHLRQHSHIISSALKSGDVEFAWYALSYLKDNFEKN